MVAVLCCCLCHLYVYSVAHSHTKNISKTLQSHHASMQRLNSICGVKPGLPAAPAPGVKRDTLMVYNEVEAGIDTCLLYSGRPQAPVVTSSANNLSPHPPQPPAHHSQPPQPPATPRPPQRTCYLLLTPLALLSAWTPNIAARIISSSDSDLHLSLTARLSVNLPLLILGCLNPWLYHKLSLGRCDGENCLSQQLDLTQSYASHLTKQEEIQLWRERGKVE